MQIDTAFPSEFLKAADLQNHEITVTIDHVEMREVGDGSKPVLFFEGKSKGLVLNKTNAATIKVSYGGETDSWRGKELILFPTTTSFEGRIVDAIRCRIGVKAAMSDEIPF